MPAIPNVCWLRKWSTFQVVLVYLYMIANQRGVGARNVENRSLARQALNHSYSVHFGRLLWMSVFNCPITGLRRWCTCSNYGRQYGRLWGTLKISIDSASERQVEENVYPYGFFKAYLPQCFQSYMVYAGALGLWYRSQCVILCGREGSEVQWQYMTIWVAWSLWQYSFFH